MNNIKPIFIFSLPRSGSTLLQRILMSHDKVSSIAEPHFLLPFVYVTKQNGTVSNYSHFAAYKGMKDVLKNLPNGEKDYYQFLNDFSIKIYNSLSNKNSVYFLDKTPSYFWIIPEIEKIFPKAKFIFLFRNPVQIFSSILITFSNKRLNKHYRFIRTLDEGFDLLSNGYEKIKNKSYCIHYENLIENPDQYLKEVFNYLELEYDKEVLNKFSDQDLKGMSVDPTGIGLYKNINHTPLKKWETVFNTSYRKKILKNYINSLEENSLKVQGYDKQIILSEIDMLDTKGDYNYLLDVVDNLKNKIIIKYKPNLLLGKNMEWAKNEYLS